VRNNNYLELWGLMRINRVLEGIKCNERELRKYSGSKRIEKVNIIFFHVKEKHKLLGERERNQEQGRKVRGEDCCRVFDSS